MVIKIPQLHDFPQALKNKVSKKIVCPLPEWEISVPRKDNLAWSIVLSYLMSTNYKDPSDGFKIRLKALTGSDKNSKSVNKSIRGFNPFRNRYSCFYDTVLKTVVNEFRIHLSWDSLISVSNKVSAASKTLDCPILLIRDYGESEKFEIYKKNVKRDQILITLLPFTFTDDDYENNTVTVFNFMINRDHGLKMKKAALLYFLEESRITKKELKQLQSICNKNDNFLIAVLNSDYKDVILKLYESPYIISKLSDAGYDMDPRTRDSEGLSALHHALLLENPNILHKLYYFAANDCCQSEGSYRNPDANIVSNLHHMEELLVSNLSKLKGSSHQQPALVKCNAILRLNRFLIEVNSKILNIKSKLNYYESTEENIFEANKRRDVIITLLDTYENFFKGTEQGNTLLSPLDDYIFYRNYYNFFDIATAKIFFDNIIFLKERLRLENENQFSEIESSFFISVIYHIIIEKVDILHIIKNLEPNLHFDMKCLYIFPLKKRQDNVNKIKDFCQILYSTTINKDNVIKYIPEREIYSVLNSYPVFKDVIEICRLRKYINVDINTRVSDVKSALVIELVLQVIGEYIAPAEKDDFSFRRLISVCLPKDNSRILRHLRHLLSHLKGHAFPSKLGSENNLSLFRSIQKEICQIKIYFERVYHMVILRFGIYVMKQLEEELERIKCSIHLYTYSNVCPNFLNDDYNLLLRNLSHDYFQKYKSSCCDFLKISLQNLEEEIMSKFLLSSTRSSKDLKNQIIYIMWPLKWLLELLQRCGMDNTVSLLEAFEAIEKCDGHSEKDIKKNTGVFLTKCNEFLPTFNLKRKKKKLKTLKSIEYTKRFMKILKGSVYLTNEEKDKIREEIPENVRQDVLMKEKLIQSIENGFSLDINEHPAEFELSYLSNKKKKAFKKFYESKDPINALTILRTIDPISELEEIFLKNSADKKRYEALCETMQFSDKTRKKLGALVAGQKEKNHVNSLSILLDRILLLKKFLIDDHEEIHNLWIKIKSPKSRLLIDDKIVSCYLKNPQLQAAVQMLLLDCMTLLENVEMSDNPWIKSSRLYSGINLRNVISHGSPLLESLCEMLDPQDFSSELIKKMLLLIKGEDAIRAILELYEMLDSDFVKFQEVLYVDEKDKYSDLRDRITKCEESKNYMLLLPYNPTKIPEKL